MVHRIRHLGVVQTAKVLGFLYLLLGIIMAVIFFAAGSAFRSMMPTTGMGSPFPMSPGLMTGMRMLRTGSLVVLPVVYGVLGFILGALTAWLYNLVASWTGGLELELEARGQEGE